MQAKYNVLHKNNTWSLVLKTPHMNVVGSKWVFCIKYKADGKIDKHRARLVAKGFHQTPGIDFSETINLVIKPSTVKLMLTLAASLHWPVHQIDINNTFLNGLLNETMYMTQPEGFVESARPTHVCNLNKALYGLK